MKKIIQFVVLFLTCPIYYQVSAVAAIRTHNRLRHHQTRTPDLLEREAIPWTLKNIKRSLMKLSS